MFDEPLVGVVDRTQRTGRFSCTFADYGNRKHGTFDESGVEGMPGEPLPQPKVGEEGLFAAVPVGRLAKRRYGKAFGYVACRLAEGLDVRRRRFGKCKKIELKLFEVTDRIRGKREREIDQMRRLIGDVGIARGVFLPAARIDGQQDCDEDYE